MLLLLLLLVLVLVLVLLLVLVLVLVLFAFGPPYRSGKAGRYNPQGGAHGCATFL
ncbi:hypothetical protein [Xanthomonas arboricola]|uniref:hypothetical protein n=1 Tax=Xanthomonas arboricola TaxID=56448 RepID=UPI001374AD54|nr:hypothetical protein [Xanthomonas arboricola]